MTALRSPKSSDVARAMSQADARNRPTNGRAMVFEQRQRLSGSYDVAQTVDENTKHWARTDALSADAAASSSVRKTIRERARYEIIENNSYGKGIALTLANDTIGCGPKLQLRTPDKDVNQQVERRFAEWGREVWWADRLRLMRLAKAVDGETFATFLTNPALRHPVKLDFSISECDQWTQPFWRDPTIAATDGIEFDAAGNPVAYHRLKNHPGDLLGFTFDTERVPASQVIHLFRADRPGQHRGVSEFVTTLPLFAQLRRYKLACLAAAETAADLAAIIHTNANAIAEPDDIDALTAIPIERRALLTMPAGWDMSQLKSEHPPTTFDMFEASIIQEIGRAFNMPFNVAATNSSTYNYASGRLDHQTYFKSIDVERRYFEVACLDRILDAWLGEAGLIPGLLPSAAEFGLTRWSALVPHEWFWGGHEHVDPAKEASAQTSRLANGTTHRAAEYARDGKDVDEEDERAAASFGVTIEDYRAALFQKLLGSPQAQEPADQGEEDEPPARRPGRERQAA